MRILKLSDVYFPRVNGVSTSIQTFRASLAELGHESTLIAPSYPRAARDADAGMLRIRSWPVPRDPEDRVMNYRALLSTARAELAMAAHDVIHVHTPFLAHYAGVRLKREFGLPLVETYHTYFEEYLQHYVPFLPGGALKRLARRVTLGQCAAVDALVVPSTPMLRLLEGYGVTAPAVVLPTGLGSRAFTGGDGARFRARHGLAADQPVLVHISRVAHEKNIDFIVRMFVRVHAVRPAATLVIAGEGPAVHHLRALVTRLGLADAVRFVGYLDRATDLKDCYRAGNVFVFASRTETQGLVLLEAMALGTPVVSTAVLGTAEVLADAGGALVVPEDEGVFAEAVLRVLDDRVLAARLAAGGPSTAAAWSAEAMARRLVALYRRVASHRAALDVAA